MGHNLICSMSAVGSCTDNAAAESFFGVLKRERINRRHYQTRAEARAVSFDYIERFHVTAVVSEVDVAIDASCTIGYDAVSYRRYVVIQLIE